MLTFTIMAHPSRAEHVREMSKRLQEQGAGPVSVSMDTEGLGCWGNARRAWGMGDPRATHRLVLQDDISFCADFVQAAGWCARLRPKDPISFFLPRKEAEQAEQQGLSWVQTRRFLWGQALMLPTPVAQEFLAWTQRNDREEWGHHDDVRFGEFFKVTKRPVFVPVPTLVEHVGAEASLLGNPNSASRRSRHYLGDDARAMTRPLYDLRTVKG